jgi:hypothetical protein
MKKVVVYLFVALLFVGTPWLAIMGTLSTTALNNKEGGSLIVKGVISGDVEERSEEEDTHETTESNEEEDEASYKLLSDMGAYFLPIQLSIIIHHQASLFKEHHREILTPPPQA